MEFQVAEEKRLLQLNKFDEFHHEAYENVSIYKESRGNKYFSLFQG